MGHVLVVFRLGFPSLAFADETESCVFGFPQDRGGQRFSVGSDVDRSAVSDCLHQAGAHLILRYSPSRYWSRRCSRRVMSDMSGLYLYSGIGLGGSANRGKDRSGAVLDLDMVWVCQLLFCVGDTPVFSGRAGPARAGWFGIPCLSESWWGSCSLPGPSGRPIGTVPGVGKFLFPGWCPG